MEHKSNSYKVNRQQREKVLRFSIRKYSFGAASVAVAALMFLGARVASADSVSETTAQSTASVVNHTEKDKSPVGAKEIAENKVEVANNSLENKGTALVENSSNTVDKSQLRTVVEELNSLLSTKLNLDDSVLSSVKDRVQKAQALLDKADAVQKDINELKELLSADLATLSNAVKESSKVRESNTGTEAEKPVSQSSSEVRASEESQTVSAKKDSLKVSVDQLQAAILEVPKHDTTKEVLEKANEVMVLAQGVLQNTTVSLTDVEQMTKRVKRMFNSIKIATTRLTSGSRDPRNGQRIAEGTGFRADIGRVEGALNNVKEYISEDKFSGDGTTIGNRDRTINKTFMTAKYSQEGSKKFITYDVYFQNDGTALSGFNGDAFWFYPPRDLLYNGSNSYPVGVVSDVYYERYQKNAGATGTLSHNLNNFTRVGNRYTVPLERLASNGYQDSGSQRLWGDAGGLFQMSGGPTSINSSQLQQMLKGLKDNAELNRIVRLNNGQLPRASYSHLLTVSSNQNYAYKFHIKVRLRDDVTDAQAQNAGTIAVTAKEGKAFNALQAYVYAATGTRLESKPDAQIDPIQGLTVTKTVGDALGNPDDPANSGYVRHKNGKSFPGGMTWSWKGDKPTSTAKAGVFKYKVVANYQDGTSSEDKGSGSDGTVTLKVKPKTPVIEQSSVNEKAGKTGQNVVVTVQDGVPDGSTVILYNGDAVIGRGTTSGRTATINVSGALPSTGIRAKTTVTNNDGIVESAFSEAVTPTEVPDHVAPTVSINGKSLTENADDNRFIIYRGANFNPTFRVQDDKSNVNLSITGLPKGVGNLSTSGDKDFNYTIPDNTVANDASFGEGTATVVATDARNNSATYKFKYRIVDVQSKDTPKTVAINSTLGNAQNYLKVVDNNTGTEASKYLPDGVTYKWLDSTTFVYAPNSTILSEAGTVSKYYATASFPQSNTVKKTIDNVEHTIYYPANIPRPVVFNVQDNLAPRVSLQVGNDTIPLTTTAENRFVIFRGATFNPTLTVSDNSGTVSYLKVSGLPSGRELIKDTAMASGTNVTIDGGNEATSNAGLGRHEASVLVRDASGNEETYKFAYTVEDAIIKETPKTVPLGTKLGTDSHDYVKLANSTEPDYTVYPNGMAFKWKKDNVEVTDRETALTEPGRVTGYKAVVKFPAAGFYTKNGVKIYTPDSIERDITFLVQPTAPTVTAKDNGDVLITPTNQTNVDKVSVTFTKQDDSTEVTYTAKKNASGVWEFGSGAPLTVDPTTGVFRLKDRVVKDGSIVTAKALTTDGTGSVQSNPVTGIAGNGDAVLPEIEFKNTVIDAQGNRVVYITPTETTNLDVATITDNSNKLLEAVFFDQGAGTTDLGNYGLTYNKVIRNGDTITNAPLTFTVRGTLNKIKSGSTLWGDDEVIITRYASAMDAAENNIKDKSGSRDNVASNPYRVVFKTLTQATKYTPTVSKSKIERDITQANTTITAAEFNKIKDTLTFSSTRGEVKVNKNTSGLELAMKNSTVQTKQDGTLYITATVTYPDGSREDIEVPLDTTNANKAKPTLTIPEVSVKAAKAKNAQGSVPATEYNRVLNNVTVPQGQPQPTAKEVKNNGRISVVAGKNVVTVGLTFSDNTKKDVTVPVLEVKPIDITTTFNELDNTVTVKPNTTVEINDRLQFGIRGKSMALTKTASGYTKSVNDRTITVNQDGSITITLVGEEKFQAGDRIVTRHESNKNGKVDSYETEAFAGLKPVEKVPAINLTALTNDEKEAVKAAVKKANPSVNTAELEVAANGDVTYRHKGAGVGTSDPTPVITLSETVRERNDAEKINPTIATLTRYVKETKHTDEQIKNAITGEHIANKAITGDIPTNGGTVVVKVTYTDGSSENVIVPIIVTPELTPVKNLNNLTNNEKEAVKAKIQTLNPTATNIVVKNNGETTLTIPDVTTAPLTPAQTVKEADLNGIQPPAVTPVKNTGALTPEEKGKVEEAVKKVNPKATKVEVGDDGSTTVTFEDGTTAPLTPAQTVKEADSNGLVTPPVADIPEFNGAVNGEVPYPVELPKVQLIITKWIDEEGNELKPADAKAPAVLGEANEAFEHGEIEGYVFVKTKVEGDVVTHVFRKVTPTKPEGNGGQQGGANTPQPTPEVPTDNTERKPETEKPTVPDTRQAEQPTQTVDAQVAPSQNQAVLPNTGTKADRATGALGALSLLGAFGLLFAKKKKDDEEETRNN